MLLLPLCAQAECGPDNAQIKQALSPEARAIRDALLARLCSRTGMLVDFTDRTLDGRLTPPQGPEFSDRVPDDLFKAAGHVLIGFLVDIDGSVKEKTVIATSGSPPLDAAAMKYGSYRKFQRPGLLDGHPVRLLMYLQFSNEREFIEQLKKRKKRMSGKPPAE